MHDLPVDQVIKQANWLSMGCCPGLVRLMSEGTGLERLDLTFSDRASIFGLDTYDLEKKDFLQALSRLHRLRELLISRCRLKVRQTAVCRA